MPIFKLLVLREIRETYITSIGGLAWVLVVPVVQLAIYAFVFTQVLKVRIPGADLTGFVPYLAVAFWPWIAFADAVMRGTTALTDSAELIGKVAVPHHVLVLAKVTAAFALHMAGYLAVLVVLQLTGTHLVWAALPAVIWLLGLVFALTVALALILSATQVFLRDLRHALQPLLMLGFFACPILYSMAMVPERFHGWLRLNPFTYFVERLRAMLLDGNFAVAMMDFVIPAGIAVFLALAIVYFRRLAPRLEEFL